MSAKTSLPVGPGRRPAISSRKPDKKRLAPDLCPRTGEKHQWRYQDVGLDETFYVCLDCGRVEDC